MLNQVQLSIAEAPKKTNDDGHFGLQLRRRTDDAHTPSFRLRRRRLPWIVAFRHTTNGGASVSRFVYAGKNPVFRLMPAVPRTVEERKLLN